MLYGFIVGAILIINVNDRAQSIPFRTMADCKVAERFYQSAPAPGFGSKLRYHCVATGVKYEKS